MAQAGETGGVLTAAADMLKQAENPDFEGSFRLPPKPAPAPASPTAAALVASAAPDSPTSMQTDLSSVAQQREADEAAAQARPCALPAPPPLVARRDCVSHVIVACRLPKQRGWKRRRRRRKRRASHLQARSRMTCASRSSLNLCPSASPGMHRP